VFEKFETKSKNNEIVQGFGDDILRQQGAFTPGQVQAIVLGKILLTDFGVVLRDFKPDNFGLVKIGEPDSWKIHITDVDMVRRLGDTRTAKGRLKGDTSADLRKIADFRIRGKDSPATKINDVRVDLDGIQRVEGNVGLTKDALDKGIATPDGDGRFTINPDDKLANELLDKFVEDPDAAIQDIFGNDKASADAIQQKRAIIQKQGEERAQKLREEQLTLENAERAEAEAKANEAEIGNSIDTELPKIKFATDGDDGGSSSGGGFSLDDFDTDGEISSNQTFETPKKDTFLLDSDNGSDGSETPLDTNFGTNEPNFGAMFGDLFKNKGDGDSPPTGGGS